MSRLITVTAGLALAALLACQRMKPVEDVLKDARAAHARGEDRAATIHLKNLLQQEPGNSAARRMLGELHLAQGDPVSAEKELRRAMALGEPRAQVLPALVKALLGQAAFQGVLDELRTEPDTAVVLAWRGHALAGLGRPDDAARLYVQALNKDNKLVAAHLGQARLALLHNDAKTAAAAVELALAANAHDLEAMRLRGDLLRSKGDLSAALAAYRAILGLDKANVQAHADIAGVLLQQGQAALARRQLESARKFQPASLVLLYAQALLDLGEGQNKAALEHAQAVLHAAPDHLPSMLLAATAELETGAIAEARAHIQHYRQSQPGEPYALRLQAMCDLREGKAQDALALLEPIIAEGSQDVDVLALAGEAAMRTGKYELAGRWFAQASSLAPDSGTLLAANGLSQLTQGQDARAIDALEQATRLNGTSAQRAGILLVITHMRARHFDEAMAQVRHMEADGKNPAVENLKGGVELARGNVAGARKAFERALQLDPAHLPALENLAQLDIMENKLPEARLRYQAALERNRKSLPLLMALAKLETRQGNAHSAASWLERAIAAAPDAIAPAQALATLYLRSGQATRALQQAQRLQALRPDDAANLDLLAQSAAAVGQHTLALESLQKLAALQPQSADVQLRVARANLILKQKDLALVAVHKALALQPGREDALLLASAVLLDKHAYDDARKLAQGVQQRQPTASIGYKLEGDALLEQGKAQQAVTLYERGLALQASGPMLIALHRALHAAQLNDKAERRIADWLGQHPDDLPTRLYHASFLLQRSDFATARREYESLLVRDPDNVVALNDLAWTLLQLRDGNPLQPAERAYRLAPANPAVADTLAWIFAETGQPVRALPLLKKALDSAPTSADIRLHYAHVLFRSGDKRGARDQCEQLLALQDFPRRDEVEKLMAKL
jgi:putative PEP-CTERM system TPR-repeat lipoprotein